MLNDAYYRKLETSLRVCGPGTDCTDCKMYGEEEGDGGINSYCLASRASYAIIQILGELRLCRNELCLKCGDYKMAYKGACDGCRWKEIS